MNNLQKRLKYFWILVFDVMVSMRHMTYDNIQVWAKELMKACANTSVKLNNGL